MGKHGNDDLAASSGQSPADAAVIEVDRLDTLPTALAHLARLVAQSQHLRPLTVRRVAAEHGRTLLTLSDVLARRHNVPGATAPALLGVAGELRAHAHTLATVRATTRDLHPDGEDDPQVGRQLSAIRRRLRVENRRVARDLTDADLHVVVASLRPALWVAPALRCAISRHLSVGTWMHQASDGSWQPATTASVPRLVDAALAARESALRLMGSLPTTPPLPPADGRAPGVRARARAAGGTSRGSTTRQEVDGAQLA